MKVIRTVGAYVWAVAGTLAIGTTVGLLALVDRRGVLWWPVARLWGLGSSYFGGARDLRVQGGERLAETGGAIVMVNHESHLDPPLIMRISRSPLRALAKHTLFYFPVMGWAMWSIGMISVNRGNRQQAFRSIKRASQSIREGKRVLVFPEGTRATSDEMLPYKKGGFVMAISAQVPIVPVGVGGTRAVWPRGWHWFGRGPVAVVVGEPIDVSSYTIETKDALMELVRTRIHALRAEARALLPAAPGDPTVPGPAGS